MQTIIEFFEGNPWFNLVSFFLGVIGIILAFLFYFKSIREKRPVYTKQTIRLINQALSALKNIEIKYNSVPVQNLSLTKIALWNSGKESIRNTDISSSEPLLITTNGRTIIYGFEVSYQKKVNNVQVTKVNEESLGISFEFLDFNDGLVLDVFHSGSSSGDIVIKGTLIGARKISQGIPNGYFVEQTNFLITPINRLLNHKNIILRIVSWTIIFPIAVVILFPLSVILTPLDFINDKLFNKTPKDFQLSDD